MQDPAAFRRLSQEEHARLRPDAYVGSVERAREHAFVLDMTTATGAASSASSAFSASSASSATSTSGAALRVVKREVHYSPALLKVFDEILVNAADNKVRDPRGQTYIKIWLRRDGFTIENDGASLPVAPHPQYGDLVPALVFGALLTGSNFDDDQQKETGGRNGMGAKLTNLFSRRFTVTTLDAERRKRFEQTWIDGMRSTTGASVTDAPRGARSFTRIDADLDLARLGHDADGLDDAVLALLARRAADLAAFFGRSLRVSLNDQALPVDSLAAYARLFLPATAGTTTAEDFLVWRAVDGKTELVLASVPHGGFAFSLVNGIHTPDGGTHVQQVQEALQARVARVLKDVLGKGSDGAIETFAKAAHIREHACIFLSCTVVNPAFTSQAKTRLSSRAPLRLPATLFDRPRAPGGFGVTETTPFVVALADSIRARTVRAARDATATRGTAQERRTALLAIPKLDDANWAGSARAHECSLILTEGDSAKTLAVAGLAVVGRDRYGVFPLKGKLLNVHGASAAAAVKNEEIANLVRILGLAFGATYDSARDLRSLRYGCVIIMTDQDADGSHICGLLLNLFATYWPSLLRIRGFVKRFVTPLVKVRRGREVLHEFFSLPEFEAHVAANPQLKARGVEIKYYKGLGTSTSEEARAYFRAQQRHLLPFEAASDSDARSLARSFAPGAAAAEQRRQWIARRWAQPATAQQLRDYYARRSLPIESFVDEELIQFSMADNVRSIPSVLDGLKPSQRKVLATVFRRRQTSEVKVAQLAGAVSELMAYHHGEASLTATIVGMAQDFCGANNLPLLAPEGQFGTRLEGGADAASARYIFTRLAPVARLLFPAVDDQMLPKEREGDLEIEPVAFVPVIPLLLVNGAEGIGTGWSTSVPPHHPRAVLLATRTLVLARDAAADLEPLTPWWRGFRGTVERDAATTTSMTKVRTRGVFTRSADDARAVQITELPVGRWTEAYKTWLAQQTRARDDKSGSGDDKSGGDDKRKRARASAASSTASATSATSATAAVVESFTEHSTETAVRIDVLLAQPAPADDGELHALLRLTADVSLANMHALVTDEERNARVVAKFDDARDIVRAHFRARLQLYELRLQLLRTQAAERELFLSERARFILCVLNGDIVLMRRRRADLDAQLARDGFGHAADHLALPLQTLTQERLDDVLRERDLAREEARALAARDAFGLWIDDLDALDAFFTAAADLDAR